MLQIIKQDDTLTVTHRATNLSVSYILKVVARTTDNQTWTGSRSLIPAINPIGVTKRVACV